MKAGWASFKNIGDGTQGTYVGKKAAIDSYNNKQTVYELMDEFGNIVLVGIKDTNTPFHDQMKHVRLGQIIGVKYVKDIPGDRGNPFKLLSVWSDPKIVNKEWLESYSNVQTEMPVQLQQNQVFSSQPSADEGSGSHKNNISQNVDPLFGDVPFITEEDKIKKIIEIAGTKFNLTDANDIKNKVMEETKLAFIVSNLDAIITALI